MGFGVMGSKYTNPPPRSKRPPLRSFWGGVGGDGFHPHCSQRLRMRRTCLSPEKTALLSHHPPVYRAEMRPKPLRSALGGSRRTSFISILNELDHPNRSRWVQRGSPPNYPLARSLPSPRCHRGGSRPADPGRAEQIPNVFPQKSGSGAGILLSAGHDARAREPFCLQL